MKRTSLSRFVLGSLAALPLMGQTTFASFSELSKKFPADTNAVVIINVEKLMNTPLAQKEGWREKWTNAFEAGPISIPPGTTRLIAGSRLQNDLQTAKWQMSLMDFSKQIAMPEIARAAAGTSDKLWDKAAVVSPSGTYFVQMEPTVLATVELTDRQAAVAWVRQAGASTGANSEFLKQLMKAGGTDGEVTMALDLEDAFSAASIRKGLEGDPLKLPAGTKIDPETLSQVLASIKNVTLGIDVSDKIHATVKATFGTGAGMLEPVAKPLASELLGRAGINVPEIADWKVSIEGDVVTMEGDLQRPGFRELISTVYVPSPAYTDAPSQGQYSEDPAVIGKTSQQYYRAISGILDGMTFDGTYGEAAAKATKEAQRIEKLPMLNVDPALTAWGAEVTTRMREISVMLRSDRQTAQARQLAVQNPGNSGGYNGGYGGGGGWSSNGGSGIYYSGNGAAQDNATRQRAQAVAEQKSASIKEASQIMGGLTAGRAKIRTDMTAKYKIQF